MIYACFPFSFHLIFTWYLLNSNYVLIDGEPLNPMDEMGHLVSFARNLQCPYHPSTICSSSSRCWRTCSISEWIWVLRQRFCRIPEHSSSSDVVSSLFRIIFVQHRKGLDSGSLFLPDYQCSLIRNAPSWGTPGRAVTYRYSFITRK